MKINSFNEGTLIKKHNHLEYVVNKDATHAESVSDFEYDLTANNPNFFEVKDITEEKGSFSIVYNLDENYKSFAHLKKENRALKLSLMKHLLNVDPLKDEISNLHPMNIYFKNIEDIKIGFRGHRLLPKTKINNLEQYKLLIMSTLSNQSYDKYFRNKFVALAKEKDNFLYNINNANDLNELKKIVNEELNEVQTQYLMSERERKSKDRSKFIMYLLASVIVIAVISLVGSMIYTKNASEIAKGEIAKAELTKERNSVYINLYKGDEEEKRQAIETMKEETDLYDKNDVVYVLRKEKLYEELIRIDPDSVASVIEELYTNDDTETIRELSFTFENNDILNLERRILDNDLTIYHAGNEGYYDKQNKRLALKAIENGYVSMAKSINDNLKDAEVTEYLKQREIADKEKEIAEEKDKDKKKKLEKELEELKK